MGIVLLPDLLRDSDHSKSEFRQHTSTIKLLLPESLVKISDPSLRTSQLRYSSPRALWLLWCFDLYLVNALICTSEPNW